MKLKRKLNDYDISIDGRYCTVSTKTESYELSEIKLRKMMIMYLSSLDNKDSGIVSMEDSLYTENYKLIFTIDNQLIVLTEIVLVFFFTDGKLNSKMYGINDTEALINQMRVSND